MTIIRVHESLMFGALEDCIAGGDMAVVHACKTPCHQNKIGYTGTLPRDHPHALWYESGHHLYLSMTDPALPLFKPDMFSVFFGFVDRQIRSRRDVLIHCNQGCSRAPSLTLLYMAKRLGTLPNKDFATARAAFEEKYPYHPGKGLVTYLTKHWKTLGESTAPRV